MMEHEERKERGSALLKFERTWERIYAHREGKLESSAYCPCVIHRDRFNFNSLTSLA
jgi:hypothetical protein